MTDARTAFYSAAFAVLLLSMPPDLFAAKPALTQDVDSPARNGVTASCAGVETPLPPFFSVAQCVLYTVPADHILAVETFSARIQDASSGFTPWPLSLTAPNGSTYSIPLVTPSGAQSSNTWSILTPLKAYYGAGSVISVSVQVSSVSASRTSTFVLSGYLVSQ